MIAHLRYSPAAIIAADTKISMKKTKICNYNYRLLRLSNLAIISCSLKLSRLLATNTVGLLSLQSLGHKKLMPTAGA